MVKSNNHTQKMVLFEDFARVCYYSDFSSDVNNGYGCKHPRQEENGCCFCHSCPLGIEADKDDLNNPNVNRDDIDEDDFAEEGEYILVPTGEEATELQKQTILAYDRYMHRYDPEWLKIHPKSSYKGEII